MAMVRLRPAVFDEPNPGITAENAPDAVVPRDLFREILWLSGEAFRRRTAAA